MRRLLVLIIAISPLLMGCIPAPEGRAKNVTIAVGIVVAIPLMMLVIGILVGIVAILAMIGEAMVQAVWPLVVAYLGGCGSLAAGYLKGNTHLMVSGGITLAATALLHWLGEMP